MGKKLYVGNLAYGVTDSDLQTLFCPHGTVQSAQVIMDRDTGRSKGFGFVEMSSDEQAQAAIGALNGHDVQWPGAHRQRGPTTRRSGRSARRQPQQWRPRLLVSHSLPGEVAGKDLLPASRPAGEMRSKIRHHFGKDEPCLRQKRSSSASKNCGRCLQPPQASRSSRRWPPAITQLAAG